MARRDPMRFVVGLHDFDTELLPPEARDVGSEAFERAVTSFYAREFSPVGGMVRVTFEDASIIVTWMPSGPITNLSDRAGELLERGDLPSATSLLQALVAVEPKNAVAHYNLGMALSDLGQLEDAKLHLVKATHLDPDNVNALVALGVALYRSGDPTAARRRLTQAVAVDPENGYAHRNLAAVLGNLGEGDEAIKHFWEAYRLLPEDQTSVYGLAQALHDRGDDDDTAEADELFKVAIDMDPKSGIAELARQARSRIAQTTMRSNSGGVRMDAVMYILSGLETYAKMTFAEVQAVGMEIAVVGERGLEVNNPDVIYRLRSLPGEYTAMHLMALMYAAFKQVAPQLDIGFDLSQEYASAVQLFEMRKGKQ